jgi:hypothetical protein
MIFALIAMPFPGTPIALQIEANGATGECFLYTGAWTAKLRTFLSLHVVGDVEFSAIEDGLQRDAFQTFDINATEDELSLVGFNAVKKLREGQPPR